MMDLVFLICWPLLFMGVAGLVWKRWVNRGRLYILILVNLIFLSSLFYLFPLVLKSLGRIS